MSAKNAPQRHLRASPCAREVMNINWGRMAVDWEHCSSPSLIRRHISLVTRLWRRGMRATQGSGLSFIAGLRVAWSSSICCRVKQQINYESRHAFFCGENPLECAGTRREASTFQSTFQDELAESHAHKSLSRKLVVSERGSLPVKSAFCEPQAIQ